jgi:dienelactone hydrolase
MGTFDIAAAAGRANPKACLVQIAAGDKAVTNAQSEAFASALSATGRTIAAYPVDHTFESDAAADDRRAWLAARFGV